MLPFQPLSRESLHRLPDESWLSVLQHCCSFPPLVFQTISLNLIKNPNINSNLLFRADILYDSSKDEFVDLEPSRKAALQEYRLRDGAFPSFQITRTLVRLMVPRNPQLDKPIAQTCQFLRSISSQEKEENLIVYIPHASCVDELPWYHPRVRSLAYLHTWRPQTGSAPTAVDKSTPSPSEIGDGDISLHYLLFSFESLPLSDRLLRTGHHLLSTLYKHGQGSLAGYKKRVHHDQLISQQRVQDTYTELKRRHAKRLCDNWVEQTEPSKHVFEDLGIAAFLIELWKDMYNETEDLASEGDELDAASERTAFPGFVDIGCGNGVLVDVLLREGYNGWGFDARRRKTWSTFEPAIQKQLKQLILIPQPLFETHSPVNDANGGILSHDLTSSKTKNRDDTKEPIWHNGIFPTGTFIISNHADELTPWTPLLASISSSPFLTIPCCSHNLSGARFRAPCVFNSYSADRLAPTYFAANVSRSKSIAIKIAYTEINEDDDNDDKDQQPLTGDLKALSPSVRSKQPSAYSSLCDWVSHLSDGVGYVVEKEMLRLPSTRNMGIVGRAMRPGFERESSVEKMERVKRIASQERADGDAWVQRANGLVSSKANCVH